MDGYNRDYDCVLSKDEVIFIIDEHFTHSSAASQSALTWLYYKSGTKNHPEALDWHQNLNHT